jgi:hypothetical protein
MRRSLKCGQRECPPFAQGYVDVNGHGPAVALLDRMRNFYSRSAEIVLNSPLPIRLTNCNGAVHWRGRLQCRREPHRAFLVAFWKRVVRLVDLPCRAANTIPTMRPASMTSRKTIRRLASIFSLRDHDALSSVRMELAHERVAARR